MYSAIYLVFVASSFRRAQIKVCSLLIGLLLSGETVVCGVVIQPLDDDVASMTYGFAPVPNSSSVDKYLFAKVPCVVTPINISALCGDCYAYPFISANVR